MQWPRRTTILAENPLILIPYLSDPVAGSSVRFAMYPVTVQKFSEFVKIGGYRDPSYWSEAGWAWRDRNEIHQPTYWGVKKYHADLLSPVTGVSFWEAEAYAHFRGCELPTEAEWELVATNNGASSMPWGEATGDIVTSDQAHSAFFGKYAPGVPRSAYRSTASRSDLGIMDLLGNASEWVRPDPAEMNRGFGVLRGGSHWNPPIAPSSLFRDVVPLGVRDNQTGLRLIKREPPNPLGKTAPPAVKTRSAIRPAERQGLRPIARPTKQFRQEGIPASESLENWTLRVTGTNLGPRSFSLDDIRAMQVSMAEGYFVCVCRWAQKNRFRGVKLRTVLEACDFNGWDQPLFIRQRSMAGSRKDKKRNPKVYETSLTLDQIEDSLLAYEMDGQPLTVELGAPLRLVNLSLFGYKGVKCLSELIVEPEYKRGWWENRCQYDINGTIQPGTVTIVGESPHTLEIIERGKVKYIR